MIGFGASFAKNGVGLAWFDENGGVVTLPEIREPDSPDDTNIVRLRRELAKLELENAKGLLEKASKKALERPDGGTILLASPVMKIDRAKALGACAFYRLDSGLPVYDWGLRAVLLKKDGSPCGHPDIFAPSGCFRFCD